MSRYYKRHIAYSARGVQGIPRQPRTR